ncbi:EAL domain-containing protein [Lacunimicrobium album]
MIWTPSKSSTKPLQLVECRDDDTPTITMKLNGQTISVGRSPTSLLCLSSGAVSSRHAVLEPADNGYVVRDLGSRNGTFVNGNRIEVCRLSFNDIVQFANSVFRVKELVEETPQCHTQVEGAFPWSMAMMQFDRLLNDDGIVPHFQPIVWLKTGVNYGFEMLARSTVSGLENPGTMFSAAAKLDMECTLSEILRKCGTLTALKMHSPGQLFLNTHPKEVDHVRLLDSLTALRRLAPELNITIEIHEAAITNCESMNELCQELHNLKMKIAFDDFGSGQARLDELTQTPPDYLKFDIKLIREIDKASLSRLNLIGALVAAAKQFNTVCLAEGIETKAEADTCLDLGFDLAQGYFFGRPQPFRG